MLRHSARQPAASLTGLWSRPYCFSESSVLLAVAANDTNCLSLNCFINDLSNNIVSAESLSATQNTHISAITHWHYIPIILFLYFVTLQWTLMQYFLFRPIKKCRIDYLDRISLAYECYVHVVLKDLCCLHTNSSPQHAAIFRNIVHRQLLSHTALQTTQLVHYRISLYTDTAIIINRFPKL